MGDFVEKDLPSTADLPRLLGILHDHPLRRRVPSLFLAANVPHAIAGVLQQAARVQETVPGRVTPVCLTRCRDAVVVAERLAAVDALTGRFDAARTPQEALAEGAGEPNLDH